MGNSVDLSKFNKMDYSHGKSKWMYRIWHLVNYLIFQQSWIGSSKLRCAILRWFGAEIGVGVVMNKPRINIKYPWLLSIGDHSWIGESSWIYNMDKVEIGSHVNIAQGALILTGNHNYKSEKFEVFTQPVFIGDGVFVGANAVICPGVIIQDNVVLAVGSVAKGELKSGMVYSGNPATEIKNRW
ncbi:MAG: putative colanic acid biosynthesis acetyltransferase WcaF [Luteibaculaceae bacterium]|jgi:putative colanic acid biosynthesis acetyltransferase WcaF